VNDAELRRLLGDEPAPGEEEAGGRAWPIVRAAHAERVRVPWIERHSRLVIAVALLAALAVAAVTPPGRAVVDTVRESVGEEAPPENAFDRVPGGGRLLVQSASGPGSFKRTDPSGCSAATPTRPGRGAGSTSSRPRAGGS
jgi:hypothetical protein